MLKINVILMSLSFLAYFTSILIAISLVIFVGSVVIAWMKYNYTRNGFSFNGKIYHS